MTRRQMSIALVSRGQWSSVTLGELLDKYLAAKRVESSTLRTLGTYRSAVERITIGRRKLVDFELSELGDPNVGPKVIQAAHDSIDDTAIMCRRVVQFVRQAWTWGCGPSRGLIPVGAACPCSGVEIKPYRSSVPEISADTMRALWAAVDEVDDVRQQTRAFIRFLMLTGLRPWSEALTLTSSQLYRSGSRWAIKLSKHKTVNKSGAKVRSLGARAAEILLEQREAVGGRGPLWPPLTGHKGNRMNKDSVRLALRKIIEHASQAGDVDPRLYTYCLRHGFATSSLESGATLTEVKEALGHDHIQTTLRYLHAVPGREGETADRMAGYVIDGEAGTVDDLARIVGCEPTVPAAIAAVRRLCEFLGVQSLEEIEQMKMEMEMDIAGWNHARFRLACARAGVNRPVDLMNKINEYRRARGNNVPFDRRTATKLYNGERGAGILFATACEAAAAIGADLNWLAGRVDEAAVEVSA